MNKKEIKGFEAIYSVTSDGMVFNEITKEMQAVPRSDRSGNHYPKVSLYKDGMKKQYSVHRLLLESFNPVKGMEDLQVNHIDGNKSNNNIENLEWVTPSENRVHAIDILGVEDLRMKEVKAKNMITGDITYHKSLGATARHYNIKSSTVSDIIAGRQKHASMIVFRYNEDKYKFEIIGRTRDSRKIQGTNKVTSEIKTIDTAKGWGEFLNCKGSMITQVLSDSNGRKYCKGWSFIRIEQ